MCPTPLNALYFQSEDFLKTAIIFTWVSGNTGATNNKETQAFRKIKDQTSKTSAKFNPCFPRYFREIGFWPKNRK
jgi:hypothetical protein